MGKMLTWGCKEKPRGVPKIWPISETRKARLVPCRIQKNIGAETSLT